MNITYTVKVPLVVDHLVGSNVTLEFNVTRFDESRIPKRKRRTTLSGAIYTLTHHVARRFSVESQIIKSAANINAFDEYLRSVEYGESFTFVHPDTSENVKAILDTAQKKRVANRSDAFRYTLELSAQT